MSFHSVSPRAGALPSAQRGFRQFLQVDRPFGLIDLCLAFTAVAMAASDSLILLLQVTFLLLMLGACYWTFSGFIGRSLLWGGVATAELLSSIAAGKTPASDLSHLLILTVMLVIVYLLVSRRNVIERTLKHVEQHDQLTKLPNRAEFLRNLDALLDAPSRPHRGVAVICLDVDDYREVNRALGQRGADELLVVIAERLRGCLRSNDIICRTDGDKFLIGVAVDPAALTRVAERISTAIELPYFIENQQVRITASLGIALSEEPSKSLRDELIRTADAAMRRVKAEGKAGYEVLSPLPAVA